MQPYLLNEMHAYQAWRDRKLDNYPQAIGQLITPINNPTKLTNLERKSLLQVCSKTNLVIYKTSSDLLKAKSFVSELAAQLGLRKLDANLCADEDKISVIHDKGPNSTSYIPYTNKALNWHTDGYYNPPQQRIRAFLMHCVRPAASGGENTYLDPEIAYILLRDENPKYIQALMDTTVMTIPANAAAGKQIRTAQTGPVFLIDESSQCLYMRYTARQRNISWKNDKTVQHALAFLHEILQNNPYLFRYRLSAGEGVICNNVLHNRTAFEDNDAVGEKRLLYRARFYNRIYNHGEEHMQNVVNQ